MTSVYEIPQKIKCLLDKRKRRSILVTVQGLARLEKTDGVD